MKKKGLQNLLLFAVSIFLFSACTKNEDPTPGIQFSLSTDIVEFDYTGDPAVLSITTSHTWLLDIPESAGWVQVSAERGSGNSTLLLIPDETETLENRGPEKLAFIYNGNERYEFTVTQDFSGIYISGAILSFPANNTEDISLQPELTWELPENFNGEGAVTYSITISEDRIDWDTVAENLTEQTFRFQDELAPATQYYWRVIVKDEVGHIGISKVYTFTTDYCGYYRDGEVRLHTNNTAEAAKPVHLIFTGDGFTKEDFAEGGVFDKAVDSAVEAFFGVEPYSTYKEYFRISKVAAYSEESGATVLSNFSWGNVPAQNKSTAFSSVLDGGRSTGISCDYTKVLSYARRVDGVSNKDLENTTVLVLINLDVYAGTCAMMMDSKSVSMCPVGYYTKEIVMHEAGGHGYGRLLDEYRSYNAVCPESEVNSVAQWRGGDPWSFGANIAFNENSSHWDHYLNIPGYEDVGYFEGANLYHLGAWRPEYESCMETNIDYFNAPSREAIVRRIMKGSGGTFDHDEFLAKDVHNPPSDANADDFSTMNAKRNLPRLAPPILIEKL